MSDSPGQTSPHDQNRFSCTGPRANIRVEFVRADGSTLGGGRPYDAASARQSGARRDRRFKGRVRVRGLRGSLHRQAGAAALVVSLVALVLSTSLVADAARQVTDVAAKAKHPAHVAVVQGHRLSTKPLAGGILLLGKGRKFPAAAIPTVALAKNADKLDGLTAEQVGGSCPPVTVDLGSWCLDTAPYPLTSTQLGQNNYIFATKTCVEEGGYLPSAAQLLGAASRVKLESTIHDSQLTATIPLDPTRGLKDQREMSSTLVTTQSGSEAAGSEGVSEGATGNPQTGEPNPVPTPAVPLPESLQYVTVYSNGQKGGFAGSEPVSQPENFRCAFNKTQGALNQVEH